MREKNSDNLQKIDVLDSHTGGEPTRVVVGGWPSIPDGNMETKLEFIRQNHENWRSAVVCEPRGHNAIVGALLTPPETQGSLTGVIFFNDVGYLSMCGHALIGLVETLSYMGKIPSDEKCEVQIDTVAGKVKATRYTDGTVEMENVPGYLKDKNVTIDVDGFGKITGDVAYGGNWFFIVTSPFFDIRPDNIDDLMSVSKKIRRILEEKKVTGSRGEKVDHVELYSRPVPGKPSKNFVLCPGNAYDRAPCGTGTSAKMMAMYDKGELALNEVLVQEGIMGSRFEGRLEKRNDVVIPVIRAQAHVVSSASLIFSQKDPYIWGLPG